MSEFKSHVDVKIGSEKGFGIVFAVVFSVIGLYPVLNGESVKLWPLGIAIILILIAYLAPKILSVPNRLWFKLGMILGAVIAPVVMALVYFLAVTPTGLIARLMGKDLLRQKLDKNAKSYWIEREQSERSMKDQF